VQKILADGGMTVKKGLCGAVSENNSQRPALVVILPCDE
jgi:hypothetical protein